MLFLWFYEFLLASVFGVLSHRLFFIYGELDQYAAVILAISVILYSILSAIILLQELDSVRASILTNLLSATYLLSLGGSIALYRLVLHRTHPFPGSKLDAISKWFAAYKAGKNDQYHHVLAQLHQAHGDIIRIGQSRCTS